MEQSMAHHRQSKSTVRTQSTKVSLSISDDHFLTQGLGHGMEPKDSFGQIIASYELRVVSIKARQCDDQSKQPIRMQ